MSDEKEEEEDQTERTLVAKLRKLYRGTRKRKIYKTGSWLSVRETPRGGQVGTKYECDGDDL
jgi:hypothetical protein